MTSPTPRFAELALRGHAVPVGSDKTPPESSAVPVSAPPPRCQGTDELVIARSGQVLAWLRKRNRVRVEVGVVLPEGVTDDDVEAIRAFAARTPAPTPGIGRLGGQGGLAVMNQHRFLDARLYRIGYGRPGSVIGVKRIIGFNLPPTLAPLAAHVEEGTGEAAGAVVLGMLGRTCTLPSGGKRWRSYAGRPPVSIEARGEVGHRIVFMSTAPAKAVYDVNGSQYKGRFEDCATLTYVTTGDALSLSDACKATGVPAPEPIVDDPGIAGEAAEALARVVAIDQLHAALLAKLGQHKGLD